MLPPVGRKLDNSIYDVLALSKGAHEAMNVKVVDSAKGRYFFFHLLPAIRSRGLDLEAEIAPLEDLAHKEDTGIVFGDQAYSRFFRSGFVAIDSFLQETVSFSFSEKDVCELMEELRDLGERRSGGPTPVSSE